MVVHLSGMGFIGSMLAHTLSLRGYEFTWDDPDDLQCAWRASTATIAPSIGRVGEYLAWVNAPPWLAQYMERGAYWYASKTAPGSTEVAHDMQVGNLRHHRLPSLHVNAQMFVNETRSLFGRCRRKTRPNKCGADTPILIESHGFGSAKSFSWGWSALTRIEAALPAFQHRVALYGRASRYELAYAYPVPRQPELWRVGTDYVGQKVRRWRTAEKDAVIGRWGARAYRVFGPGVTFGGLSDFVEGWRPMGPVERAKIDGGRPALATALPGLIRVAALGSYGVRWAPEVVNHVIDILEAT